LKVDVTIKSNENSFDKPMAMMRKMDNVEKKNQIQVYVEPKRCKTKVENDIDFCEWNGSVSLRFYEIYAKATDYGGRTSHGKCTIVIIPLMSEDKEGKNRELDHVKNSIDELLQHDEKRFILETMQFEWDII